jgi:YVTN family beta-propeller protein
VVATVPTGTSPGAVAVDAATNKIYVTNAGSNNVTIIDGVSNTTTTVNVGASPNAVTVDQATNKIYVANHDDSSVTVIDGATNATTSVAVNDIPFTHSNLPVAIAVNAATNQIYAAAGSSDGLRSGTLAIIDGATNGVSHFLGAQQVVNGMALNPATNKIYVIGFDAGGGPPLGLLRIFDGATLGSSDVQINGSGGSLPSAVAVNPVTNKIYVSDSNLNNNNVTVVDGNTQATTTVNVGASPTALAVNTKTDKIYVANSGSSTVSIIDGASNSVTTVNVGTFPDAVTVDEGTNRIYVLNRDSNSVTVMDGAANAIVETLEVGTKPGAAAVNPATGKIYVTNTASNNVTVMDGTVTPPVPGLSLSAMPADLKVKLGQSATSTLTVTEFNGLDSDATLMIDGSLPTGVTAVFDPPVVRAPGGTSTLTLSASPTATGASSFTVLAMAGGNFSASTVMRVTVDTSPDFVLSVSPASLSVAQGSSGTVTVSSLAVGGFSHTLSFRVCCLPQGVSATIDPIPAPGTGQSILTFTAGSNARPGTANITIDTGDSLLITHSISVSLTVTAAPPSPVSYTFGVGTTVGSVRVVTQGTENLDFTAGAGTTCVPKTYAAGDSCFVLVRFTPRAPGLRTGDVQILDPAGNLLFQTLLSNTGIAAQAVVLPGEIGTVAGNGQMGFDGDNGPANLATLNTPYGITVDAAGNLFIADLYNHRIRRVDAATHVITTIAGLGSSGYSGDGGPAASAELNQPTGVAVDGAGNLYIADADNNVVREVDARTGIITTVAGNGTAGFSGDDGPATNAQLFFPFRVALDGTGNIYITDSSSAIRKVDAVTHLITTVAGNGSPGFSGDGGMATEAQLNEPRGLALDAGGSLYIADYFNTRIRKVDAGTQVITTVAGDGQLGASIGDGGPAVDAHLFFPPGVAVDAAGDLYIADNYSHHVRRVAAASGFIDTIAGAPDLGQGLGFNGDGLPAPLANLREPDDVVIDGAANLYVADALNQRVRIVSANAPPLTFPPTNVGFSSATQTVKVFNIGNQPLSFLNIDTIPVIGDFGLIQSVFVLPNNCLTFPQLPPGGSCNLGVFFKPTKAGQRSGTVTFETTELNGANHTVSLSGLGEP